MDENQGYTSVTVPVRLVASHGLSRPGFESRLRGALASSTANPAPGGDPFVMQFEAKDLTILGVDVAKFTVGSPAHVGDPQELAVEFVAGQTEEAIESFLRCFADALTASFAADQRNPWYGNLVVEVVWAGMRVARPSTPGAVALNVHASMTMTSEEARPLTTQVLKSLADSDLTEIFVEGMRANRPKAKYASWFIMVEEFERLATDSEFSSRFTPLFPTKAERRQVATASGLAGNALKRLQQFLGNPNHTLENRAEKLASLLQAVGITEIPTIKDGSIALDVAICDRLIDGRNALAHKGKSVDQDLLYTVLFPLSLRLMNYLDRRQDRAGQ